MLTQIVTIGLLAIPCVAQAPGDVSTAGDPAGSSQRAGADVQAALDRVLSAPEFRRLVTPEKTKSQRATPDWLRRFLEWLVRERKTPVLGTFLLRSVLTILALLAVAGVAAYILRSIWERLPNDSDSQSQGLAPGESIALTPPGELPSDEYARRAHTLAESGDFGGAIRQLLLGAMSWIERGGLIRYRRGLSNRDYLRAVRRRPVCHHSLKAIVAVFDLLFYGRRPATADRFQACLESYEAGFRQPASEPSESAATAGRERPL